jgi:hypothetical protein
MPCVSDNGATAPISALTYAFSIGSDRGLKTDDSVLRIIGGANTLQTLLVTLSDSTRQVLTRPPPNRLSVTGPDRSPGLSL